MKTQRLLLLSVLSLGTAAAAPAQLTGNLLLRQGSFTNAGYSNQWSGDNQLTSSTGMGSMVTSTDAWNISDIQILQLGLNTPGFVNSWYGQVTQAWLNVSRQVNGRPDESINPLLNSNSGPNVVLSAIVPITLDEATANLNGANQSFRVTVNTSGVASLQGLAAGDYVFSLVPIADTVGQFGRGITLSSAANSLGSDDYVRNPYSSANLPSGSAWGTLAEDFGAPAGTQWAIGINGTPVPEPMSLGVVGIGLLALVRRRK